LKQKFFGLTVALMAAMAATGCTSAPLDPTATVVPANAIASDGTPGQATTYVIMPCYISGLFASRAITGDFNVMVDGKRAAGILPCEFRQITLPAGSHAFRIAQQLMDFGGMFGNGPKFALPAGGKLYLIAEPAGNSNYDLREVSAADGNAAITEIKKYNKASSQ
jgi:hypothetical protein